MFYVTQTYDAFSAGRENAASDEINGGYSDGGQLEASDLITAFEDQFLADTEEDDVTLCNALNFVRGYAYEITGDTFAVSADVISHIRDRLADR